MSKHRGRSHLQHNPFSVSQKMKISRCKMETAAARKYTTPAGKHWILYPIMEKLPISFNDPPLGEFIHGFLLGLVGPILVLTAQRRTLDNGALRENRYALVQKEH